MLKLVEEMIKLYNLKVEMEAQQKSNAVNLSRLEREMKEELEIVKNW